MKKTKTPQTPQLQEPDTQSKRRLSLPKVAYSAFLCVMMSMIFCQPAYAATDVWTKAKEIMQDVYTQILAISTIAAIVTASVCCAKIRSLATCSVLTLTSSCVVSTPRPAA